MDTTETAEARPQNPEDEYNFADYDNEGMPVVAFQHSTPVNF